MPPKKILLPPANPNRHPAQHANDRKVARYNAAKLDREIDAYTQGQRGAKRAMTGPDSVLTALRARDWLETGEAQVAFDAAENGDIAKAHKVLGLGMKWLEPVSFDLMRPDEQAAYSAGYADGFKGRLRKIVYPGVRIPRS